MAEVIGICFSSMAEAKRNLISTRAACVETKDRLCSAVLKLEADGSPRLRQPQDAIKYQIKRVNNRISDIDRLALGIDYSVKRFHEVDDNCAKRIKGLVSECKKANNILISSEKHSWSNGTNSLLNMGKKAWKSLYNVDKHINNSTRTLNYFNRNMAKPLLTNSLGIKENSIPFKIIKYYGIRKEATLVNLSELSKGAISLVEMGSKSGNLYNDALKIGAMEAVKRTGLLPKSYVNFVEQKSLNNIHDVRLFYKNAPSALVNGTIKDVKTVFTPSKAKDFFLNPNASLDKTARYELSAANIASTVIPVGKAAKVGLAEIRTSEGLFKGSSSLSSRILKGNTNIDEIERIEIKEIGNPKAYDTVSSDSYAYQQYKKSLIKYDILSNSDKIINGADLWDSKTVDMLTKDGSNISDWWKMESKYSYNTEFGEGKIHYYQNAETGEVSQFDSKLKVPKPKNLRANSKDLFWIIDIDENFIPVKVR